MVEQSAGLSLDEYFDLQFDASGDIDSVSGVDELRKDLAIAVWKAVDQTLDGQVLTPNVIVTLESAIRNNVGRDERVTNINQLSFRQDGSGSIAQVDIAVDSVFGTFTQNITEI